MADLDLFLAPVDAVDAGTPSGIDLRNEARFHAIERKMAPAARANRRNQDGHDGNVPTDWSAILSDAAELAAEGRDLRLLVIVARSLANTDGFPGVARGLTLLSDTVAQFWDSVHPLLRDRSDPMDAALRRINALRQLENGDDGLLGDLQLNVVMNARGVGALTGEDLAAGMLTTHKVLSEAPSGLGQAERNALAAAHEERVKRVRAATRAMASEDADGTAALAGGVDAAREALTGLEARLAEALGLSNGHGVRFTELSAFLDGVRATLADAMAYADQATEEPPAETVAPADAASGTAAGRAAPTGAVPGAIASREDVVRTLEMIIAFYERTEPSSPIPHLARRMKRMVPMDFMELMTELAPGGIKEFRNVAGLVEEKSK